VAQRRWRAVAWTAGFGAALVALSLADVGFTPYAAFLRHLPGIFGGEAFPAFRNPLAMAINFSIPGIAFKLKLFDVPGMGFAASKAIGWVYTLAALWWTVRLARAPRTPSHEPLAWLAVLVLATLRSPFLPQAYAAVPPLWLLTLLAACAPPRARTLGLTLLAWAALNVFWPLDWAIDPRVLATLMLLPQAVTIALPLLVVHGAAGREPARVP
jgi:hypothetical protein